MDEQDGLIIALREANFARQKLIDKVVFENAVLEADIMRLRRYVKILEECVFRISMPSKN